MSPKHFTTVKVRDIGRETSGSKHSNTISVNAECGGGFGITLFVDETKAEQDALSNPRNPSGYPHEASDPSGDPHKASETLLSDKMEDANVSHCRLYLR